MHRSVLLTKAVDVSKRIWVVPNPFGEGFVIDTAEPESLTNAVVTVRRAEPRAGTMFDGIWLNGNRAYDTKVICGSTVMFPVPDQGRRGVTVCFDRHEARGDGEPLAG